MRSADEVNAALRSAADDATAFKSPYKPGSTVYERVTASEEQYVRVWAEGSNSKPAGKWLVKKSDIQGLTKEQVKDVLGLKVVPTNIADVNVQAGFKIREGLVAEVSDWGSKGGKVQIEAIDTVTDEMISNIQKIGDVVK